MNEEKASRDRHPAGKALKGGTKLVLTVEIPGYGGTAFEDEVIVALQWARRSGSGITLTTATGWSADVDLLFVDELRLDEEGETL